MSVSLRSDDAGGSGMTCEVSAGLGLDSGALGASGLRSETS